MTSSINQTQEKAVAKKTNETTAIKEVKKYPIGTKKHTNIFKS